MSNPACVSNVGWSESLLAVRMGMFGVSLGQGEY